MFETSFTTLRQFLVEGVLRELLNAKFGRCAAQYNYISFGKSYGNLCRTLNVNMTTKSKATIVILANFLGLDQDYCLILKLV